MGFWRACPSQASVLKRSSISSFMACSSFIRLCWLFDCIRLLDAASCRRRGGSAGMSMGMVRSGLWRATGAAAAAGMRSRAGSWSRLRSANVGASAGPLSASWRRRSMRSRT